MRIEFSQLNSKLANVEKQAAAPDKGEKSFGERLTDAIDKVNETQQNADQLAAKVASGDTENVHQAMIATQKAILTLEFAVQVRNKAIEAYQELMRTQV